MAFTDLTQTVENQQGMISLRTAIEMACSKEKELPIPAPKEKRRWTGGSGELQWAHPLFGTLNIQSRTCTINRRCTSTASCLWAPVHFDDRPNSLNFVFDVNAIDEDVRILHVDGGEKKAVSIRDVTNGVVPGLKVKVRWNGNRPNTRQPDGDYIDFVFLRSDGTFVQLEVSLVTRNFRCWLAIQEIYNGQVTRTNREIADRLDVTTYPLSGLHSAFVAPFDETNAYEGSDYFKNFPGARDVVQYAVDRGAVMPLRRCKIPNWEPQQKTILNSMRKKGWETAVVRWGNLVIGWGFADCEDDAPCLISLRRVIDERGKFIWEQGGFPVLEPMSTVAIQYETERQSGKRRAVFIRRL